MGRGLWLVGTGLAIGTWGASVISRLMATLLPGLDRVGSVVIVAAAVGLVAVVIIAAHLPSLRQIRRLDPAELLRADVG
jgi:ABC-type antimicrobial peptide transport system permease subunit